MGALQLHDGLFIYKLWPIRLNNPRWKVIHLGKRDFFSFLRNFVTNFYSVSEPREKLEVVGNLSVASPAPASKVNFARLDYFKNLTEHLSCIFLPFFCKALRNQIFKKKTCLKIRDLLIGQNDILSPSSWVRLLAKYNLDSILRISKQCRVWSSVFYRVMGIFYWKCRMSNLSLTLNFRL